jgi:ribosomal protein S18 acetylase RimI-like enzyme
MMKITLEKATESDEKFVENLYFSTRKDEFAILGWSETQLEMFLKMQFESQQQSYKMQFPEAENSVIKKGEIAVGRLIVERTENEIRLVDIALLPEFRGQGIGGKIIKDLISEAENKRLPLTLTVLKTNDGALRLYQRLGFISVADDAVYISMEK